MVLHFWQRKGLTVHPSNTESLEPGRILSTGSSPAGDISELDKELSLIEYEDDTSDQLFEVNQKKWSHFWQNTLIDSSIDMTRSRKTRMFCVQVRTRRIASILQAFRRHSAAPRVARPSGLPPPISLASRPFGPANQGATLYFTYF